MVRRKFAIRTMMFLIAIVAFYLIINLFINGKSWVSYALALTAFASLPIFATLIVGSRNILPTSKVVIITAIWSTWIVLSGIAAFATYYYLDNHTQSYYPGYPCDLCGGSVDLLQSR